MQLVVFSSPTLLEHEAQLISSVLERGLETFHLRKPGCSLRAYEAILAPLSPAARAKLVVHDHHELATRWGLKGVHYTERARAKAGHIKALPGLTSSTALHQLEQLQEDHRSLDYAFLSPIFDSISKAGYSAAFADHEQLSAAVAASSVPLFALGGIEESTVRQGQDLNFVGVAALGSIWNSSSAPDAVSRLLDACALSQKS
ncbi:hypothetical protein WJX74_005689 [Apatococcus lobatus]|uniref:Thiamine phosphate synthase/TenI domain-containing protein n=1 Tax=Apatococcus lobatus TaxID=904363 RepID=A0AAW1RW13_9CHLO